MKRDMIVGSYRKDFDHSDSMISITLFPKDLVSYWSRCGLTADFAATFFAFRFQDSKRAGNSLSVILNEIVENAVKFSFDEKSNISINLFNLVDQLVFEVENFTDNSQFNLFVKIATELMDPSEDIETKYFRALQAKAESEGSGLGLITILHDYNAKLGVRFLSDKSRDSYKVSLQVGVNPGEVV